MPGSISVTRHDSALGRWELARARPAPALCPFVRQYEGYTEEATHFGWRLEVPSRDVALIINFGPAFRVIGPRESAAPRAFGSFVAGLHDAHALVASTGPSDCLQVDFTPLGAHRFFGVPMVELAGRTVALDDLLGAAAARLVARLRAAPTWEARFALLDRIIAARLDRAARPDERLAWCWGRLAATGGALAIADLATAVGWSERHLIARFREGLGLPLKTLARVLRFNRAVRLVARAEGPPDWIALAHLCGYYDQAHLIRDFRRFSGSTPGAFARRQIPGAAGVVGDC